MFIGVKTEWNSPLKFKKTIYIIKWSAGKINQNINDQYEWVFFYIVYLLPALQTVRYKQKVERVVCYYSEMMHILRVSCHQCSKYNKKNQFHMLWVKFIAFIDSLANNNLPNWINCWKIECLLRLKAFNTWKLIYSVL